MNANTPAATATPVKPKNELVVRGPVDYEDVIEGGYNRIFDVVSCDVEEGKCNLEYENRPIPIAGLSDAVLNALPEGWAKAPPGPRFFTQDLRKLSRVGDDIIALLREERGVKVTIIHKPSPACTWGD